MKSRIRPIGAELSPDGVTFRVWAPEQKRVSVQLEGRTDVAFERSGDGYFDGFVRGLPARSRYKFRLGTGETLPDPASRYQPEGPHGPSEVVDPNSFSWTDHNWKGRTLEECVIYEMHIGTLTPVGNWSSAIAELDELAALGITCLEVMPVSEFPGRWGWGYDGVGMFAPFHGYGAPDDFKRFVDAAHRLGICVILDVVYNHLGPDGNYLQSYTASYFSSKHKTDWGEAINFDGPDAGPVRDFVLANVEYWIRDFHLDGLRLDATQDIYDDSPPDRHILTEIGRTARSAAPDRTVIIISENEPQRSELCRPLERGGHGLDGFWNDDFHHSAMVALTGRCEAYFSDYRGDPQEFVSAAKHGFLYQGQYYSWQKKNRGQPAFDLGPSNFISFIQNHDQIANSGHGRRAHELGNPGCYRALMALILLGPATPMLFQGQEFAASTPFLYFADHQPELAALVDEGRRKFLSQFPSLNDPACREFLPASADPETFQRCKLIPAERTKHAEAYSLTRDLLELRRCEPCFRAAHRIGIDGAVLGAEAFVLRYFLQDGQDRLLLVNLGRDLIWKVAPEPLLGCGSGESWQMRISTDSPIYGGSGAAPILVEKSGWRIPGQSAQFLALHSAIGQRTTEEER